jgi:hypothetical protein
LAIFILDPALEQTPLMAGTSEILKRDQRLVPGPENSLIFFARPLVDPVHIAMPIEYLPCSKYRSDIAKNPVMAITAKNQLFPVSIF